MLVMDYASHLELRCLHTFSQDLLLLVGTAPDHSMLLLVLTHHFMCTRTCIGYVQRIVAYMTWNMQR